MRQKNEMCKCVTSMLRQNDKEQKPDDRVEWVDDTRRRQGRQTG